MANDNQMIPLDQFGPVADVFKNSPIDDSRFTAGIGMAWPILTLKGKTWGWRFRGESRTYDAPNPQAGGAIMPVQFLDVVIVDAGERISKVYYKEGWKDGDRAPPSCWSADGITPDAGASEKQASTCRGCRHNVFGSRIGDGGQKGKACSDNKRLAVVTTNNLANTDFGGPFMLRVPPGSFANYTTYVSVMNGRGYKPYTIVTRMMFDSQVAHPKVTFMPVRPLTPDEAAIVVGHQNNPRTTEMLNDKAVGAFVDPDAEDGAPVVADLPPAGAPTPTASGWTSPTAGKNPAEVVSDTPTAKPDNVVPMKPAMSPEQQELQALRAQLAAAKAAAEPAPQAPPPPPEPPKTPEQLEIEKLNAELAAIKAGAKKPRKPRSNPVSPPTTPDGIVTAGGNGTPTTGGVAEPDAAEEPQGDVGNDIANRIAGLTGKIAS